MFEWFTFVRLALLLLFITMHSFGGRSHLIFWVSIFPPYFVPYLLYINTSISLSFSPLSSYKTAVEATRPFMSLSHTLWEALLHPCPLISHCIPSDQLLPLIFPHSFCFLNIRYCSCTFFSSRKISSGFLGSRPFYHESTLALSGLPLPQDPWRTLVIWTHGTEWVLGPP